jgi:hypothetical protein
VRKTGWAAVLMLVAALAQAAARWEATPRAPGSAFIEGVPHVEQAPDFCGEACAEMYLRKRGVAIDQNAVFALTGVDPALGRGAYTNELAHALTSLGFDVGPVWTHVEPARAAEALSHAWMALLQDLRQGIPSIVCMHYDESPHTTEHFRLVLGYDAGTDEVIYHEPAVSNGAYRRMSRDLFQRLWTFKPSPRRWTLIRMRLDAREIRVPELDAGAAAKMAQHVHALRERLPPGFTLVVRGPFVILGDEPPERVRRRADDTVAWTMGLLRKDYFPKDPEAITDVWIFKDAESYVGHARSLFHETPTTPYGYYSSSAGAMLMNIKPGAGTLVHELVHPYMHANAPDCPAWLNEGLASLYERPGEQDGHFYGYPNWRLPALQEGLRRNAVPTFAELTSMSDATFYEDNEGIHYAQARYLCYYLQEKGLLREFFADYLAHRGDDPTGYGTLTRVLGRSLDDVQRDWRQFVLDLRYR